MDVEVPVSSKDAGNSFSSELNVYNLSSVDDTSPTVPLLEKSNHLET